MTTARRTPRLLFSLAALSTLTLAACGAGGVGGDPGFAEGAPDPTGYTLEITGDTSAEKLLPQSEALVDDNGNTVGSSSQALGGEVPEYLKNVRTAVAAINEMVHSVLTPITDIIRAHPDAMSDDAQMWVKTKGAVTFRFYLKRFEPKKFGWALQAKPATSDDSAYVNVMGGRIAVGETRGRGRGEIGIDLDKLAGVDPAFKGRGQLFIGFAHVGGYKILNFGLHRFTPDAAQFQAVDARFSGVRGPLGGTDVRVAIHANIADTATSAQELAVLHARWLPGVGGRIDAVATFGDVPDGHAIVSFSCFTGSLEAGAKGYLLVADCIKGTTTCNKLREEGAITNCARGLEEANTPPTDPMAPIDPMGAPENPPLPTTMP